MMSVIEPIDVLTRKGTKVRLRSAEVEEAAALVEYGKSILVPGESFVTQCDEFDLSEDQEREWIATIVTHPAVSSWWQNWLVR